MTLDELLNWYKEQSNQQAARLARVQNSSSWPLMEGTQGTGAMAAYDPVEYTMNAINQNPVMEGLRAPLQTLAEFATKPSVTTGMEALLENLPADKMMGLFGTVAYKDALKFFRAVSDKYNKNNPYWRTTLNDFFKWEESNFGVRHSVKEFPDYFDLFRRETRPAKGIQANFIRPEYLQGDNVEFIENWKPARDPNFNGTYDMQQYLEDPDPNFRDIYGQDYRFNRGIFSAGLKPGDEIYRGVSEGTYDLGLKTPRETGPHHSTLPDVAEEQFAKHYSGTPTGGQSVKSIWEGTGQGYLIEQDLGHFSIPNIVDRLKEDNTLPKRYLEELKDLKSRYSDAKRNIKWDDDRVTDQIDRVASQEFGKIMQDAGYDHLNYMNTHEAPGHISTIPLYPFKFKPVENTYFPSREVRSNIDYLQDQIGANLITPKEKYDTILKDFLSELNPYPKAPLLSEYDITYGQSPNSKEFIDMADLIKAYGLWGK
jgi:hypothetical protein